MWSDGGPAQPVAHDRAGGSMATSRGWRSDARAVAESVLLRRETNRDVRVGSKTQVSARQLDVCFTPTSRHHRWSLPCPFSAMNGLTLTWLLWERMLEEETQHFPRCVRSSRISVGARRAASRPCVSSPVDVPVLKDSAPTRAGMDRAGIGMPSRYPLAMHLLLRARRSDRLLKNLIAVVWMHRNVAIAVKNNGRDRWPVTQNYPVIGSATLSHGDKRRGKVNGGPTGEARMYADCRVQIVVRCSHDSGSGRSGRQSTNVDALWINRIVAHDSAG